MYQPMTWLLAIMTLGWVSIAEARRHERSGFNFGMGVQMDQGNDLYDAYGSKSVETKVNQSSTAAHPYLAYVFADFLNLGLSASFLNETSTENDRLLGSGESTIRDRNVSTQGLSLFSRFLFGQVMYLEIGAGLYQQRTSLTIESAVENGSGAFTGQREREFQNGVGTGYHGGLGIEVPVSHGFVMTAAYMMRVFNIRNVAGPDQVGARMGLFERRELMFGLSHYLR